MLKRIVPLVAVLALLLPCLLVPASAAYGQVLDYNDFITSIEVDGDNDIVTIEIPIEYGMFGMWRTDENGVVHAWTNDGKSTFSPYFYGYAVEDNYIRFRFYTFANNNFLDLSNIPTDTVFTQTFHVEPIGDQPMVTPDYLVHNSFYSEPDNSLDNYVTKSIDNLGKVNFFEPQTVSWTLDKVSGMNYLKTFVEVQPIVPTGDGLNSFTLTMYPTTMVLSISSLYRLQEETGKTNEILSAVEKQLAENGQLLEDIINRPANPKPPDGADNVTNAGAKEDQLLDNSAAGREEFNNMLGGSAASLELYTSSFAFLSACINPIIDIPWIKEILTISLGLGLTGFLLNLGISAISKAGKDGGKSSGKGGGK